MQLLKSLSISRTTRVWKVSYTLKFSVQLNPWISNVALYSDRPRLSMQLSDQSIGFDHSIKALLVKDLASQKLPQIKRPLDVIRIHRATVDDGPIIRGSISKAGCHCLAFDGNPGSDMTPRATSKSYHYVEQDQNRVGTYIPNFAWEFRIFSDFRSTVT